VFDRGDHRTTGASVLRPFGRGIELPEQVCSGMVSIDDDALTLSIDEREHATVLRVGARSAAGQISIDVSVAKPGGHESLNVVIPWSDRRFQFTSKQNTRPASGTISVGDRTWAVGATEDFAVQDLGRGIWPYAIRWNWASASGRSVDGRLVGLQFGGTWTEGTGAAIDGFAEGARNRW
jgi:hypothetical protein